MGILTKYVSGRVPMSPSLEVYSRVERGSERSLMIIGLPTSPDGFRRVVIPSFLPDTKIFK